MRPYTKEYSLEEIKEIMEWFRTRYDRLPESIMINEGLKIPNLKFTVQQYLDFVELNHENPTYAAQVLHLFRMRERLLEQGFE